MASKKDLVEAQTFSRRRLLTAFTSGAVGTTELEPAKPLRAVVSGLAITALIVVGSLFYGLISPSLPDGWGDNRILIAKDTGARYVSHHNVLYPVLNTASARLLITPGSTSTAPITTSSARLAKVPIGQPVGIVGAPDQLPATPRLVNTGWEACLDDHGAETVRISATPHVTATTGAVVVASSAGDVFVVAGAYRYLVDADHRDAVLRALGLGDETVTTVDDRWLNLFLAGTPLAPIVVTDAGDPAPGTDLRVGQVVHVTGAPSDRRYLVTAHGALAELSPLAYGLYLLGTGTQLGDVQDVSVATTQAMPNAAPQAAADWPTSTPQHTPTGTHACAVAGMNGHTATTTLAVTKDDPGQTAPTTTPQVDPGAGAIVAAGGHGNASASTTYLVDATGTAFPITPASDAVTRLGYTFDSVGAVDDGWIALLPVGPRLSVAAAGTLGATASATP